MRLSVHVGSQYDVGKGIAQSVFKHHQRGIVACLCDSQIRVAMQPVNFHLQLKLESIETKKKWAMKLDNSSDGDDDFKVLMSGVHLE